MGVLHSALADGGAARLVFDEPGAEGGDDRAVAWRLTRRARRPLQWGATVPRSRCITVARCVGAGLSADGPPAAAGAGGCCAWSGSWAGGSLWLSGAGGVDDGSEAPG